MTSATPARPSGTETRGKATDRISGIRLRVRFTLEADGRHIAEVVDIPGVVAYGVTREEAHRGVTALALHVIADQIEHGETSTVELVYLETE